MNVLLDSPGSVSRRNIVRILPCSPCRNVIKLAPLACTRVDHRDAKKSEEIKSEASVKSDRDLEVITLSDHRDDDRAKRECRDHRDDNRDVKIFAKTPGNSPTNSDSDSDTEDDSEMKNDVSILNDSSVLITIRDYISECVIAYMKNHLESKDHKSADIIMYITHLKDPDFLYIAMYRACFENNIIFVKWLLSDSTYSNIFDWSEHFDECFNVVCQCNHSDMLKIFHTDHKIKNINYSQGFQYACSHGCLDLAKTLYELSPDNIDLHIDNNINLRICCKNNALEFMNWLLSLDNKESFKSNSSEYIFPETDCQRICRGYLSS